MAKGLTVRELEKWFADPKVAGRLTPAFEQMGVDPKRYMRYGVLNANQSPQLLSCDPWTIAVALLEAAALGLEPNGVLGQAYLIRYKNTRKGRYEAKLQVGYRGLVALVHRTGRVAATYAREVYDRDDWTLVDGTGPDAGIRVKPYVPPGADDPKQMTLDNEEQVRGSLVLFYSVIHFIGGSVPAWEWMPVSEVERIRRAANSARADTSPWLTHYEAMGRKTVLKRNLWRNAPLDTRAEAAIALDSAVERGEALHLHQVAPDLLADVAQEVIEEQADDAEDEPPTTAKRILDRAKADDAPPEVSKADLDLLRGMMDALASEDEVPLIKAALDSRDPGAVADWIAELKARAQEA